MSEIIPITRAKGGRPTGETPGPRSATPLHRRVYVLFTDIEDTLNAVAAARRLVSAVGGRVTIVHFRPLDFGAPLDAPAGISPAESAAFRDRVAAEGCEADVSICVCRDARRALAAVVDPHSLVVVGGHHRWWPTVADRWRRRLEAAGHLVVSVEAAARG